MRHSEQSQNGVQLQKGSPSGLIAVLEILHNANGCQCTQLQGIAGDDKVPVPPGQGILGSSTRRKRGPLRHHATSDTYWVLACSWQRVQALKALTNRDFGVRKNGTALACAAASPVAFLRTRIWGEALVQKAGLAGSGFFFSFFCQVFIFL